MLYLISLGAGLLVGIIYSLINVRSPAPPLVALVGLLGMLAGEQIIPVGKRLLSGSAFQPPGGKRSAQRTFLACCRAAMPTRPQKFPQPISQRTAHDRSSRSHCDQCSCDQARSQLIVGGMRYSAATPLRQPRRFLIDRARS